MSLDGLLWGASLASCGIMIGGLLGEYTTIDQMQKQAVSRGFAVYDMETQDFRWKETQLESERDQDR